MAVLRHRAEWSNSVETTLRVERISAAQVSLAGHPGLEVEDSVSESSAFCVCDAA